jgi:hypothetical protein
MNTRAIRSLPYLALIRAGLAIFAALALASLQPQHRAPVRMLPSRRLPLHQVARV